MIARGPYRSRSRPRRIPLSKDELEARESRVLKPVEAFIPGTFNRFALNKQQSAVYSSALGPFSRVDSQNFPGHTARRFERNSSWYRSKGKSRVQPLEYGLRTSWVTKLAQDGVYFDSVNSMAGSSVNVGDPRVDGLAMNRARERFITELRDKTSSQLGATVAEWEQSEKMIVLRAGQLLSAFKALKSGDVAKLERAVQIDVDTRRARRARKSFRDRWAKGRNRLRDKKVPYPDRVREWSKTLSDLWLEYHFGWAPLLDDISGAISVLKSDPPSFSVRTGGRESASSAHWTGDSLSWSWKLRYEAKARIGATVFVSNANFALANQLGLINPASVAWEVVPFSFLVDWFIPVGKFLESWTDLLGYSIEYPFNTIYRVADSSQAYFWNGLPVSGGDCSGVGMVRSLGIPPYRFVRPQFKGFSVARGATAIALVIQQFLSLK